MNVAWSTVQVRKARLLFEAESAHTITHTHLFQKQFGNDFVLLFALPTNRLHSSQSLLQLLLQRTSRGGARRARSLPCRLQEGLTVHQVRVHLALEFGHAATAIPRITNENTKCWIRWSHAQLPSW